MSTFGLLGSTRRAERVFLFIVPCRARDYALEMAAQALAIVWKADRALAREGPVRKVPILAGVGRARKVVGYRQQKDRCWSIKIEAEKQYRSFASPFGLVGPSSRVPLRTDNLGAEGERELWAMISGPRVKKDAPKIPDAPPAKTC